MARFCIVVTFAACCLVTGSSVTDMGPVSVTRECSVERSGVLTMFNGQTSTVAVPCKYRLADIQCGDYRLVVTPGSKLDSDNTFSPDTVLVNIKTTLKENLFVRTTAPPFAKVSVYQQCAAAANASDTRDCDYIFLDKATVDCLAGSGTPLIDHYRRCLETACGANTSAMAPTLAYINDNCADWLNSTCSADSDCPAARNATCFEGLCLCTPGYYYSLGQDTCVEECAQRDLQETFLKYPGSGIEHKGIFSSPKDTEKDCVDWCRNVTECRTVVYYSLGNYCYLQSKTALEVPADEWFTVLSDFNHYQKMCA